MALKRIVGPHAENEHWNVVSMKEEFANSLSKKEVSLFQQPNYYYF